MNNSILLESTYQDLLKYQLHERNGFLLKQNNNKLLTEGSISRYLHTSVDMISMLADVVSFGSAGAVIDAIHAFTYLCEYSIERDPKEKEALMYDGLITLGSVFLPAMFQTIAPVLKNMVRGIKSPKLLKSLKISDDVILKLKKFMDDLMKVLNNIYNKLKNFKSVQRYSVAYFQYAKIIMKKTPKYDKDYVMNYARYFMYFTVIGDLFAKKGAAGGFNANTVESIMSLRGVKKKAALFAIKEIGDLIDFYVKEVHIRILRIFQKDMFKSMAQKFNVNVKIKDEHMAKLEKLKANIENKKKKKPVKPKTTYTRNNSKSNIKGRGINIGGGMKVASELT